MAEKPWTVCLNGNLLDAEGGKCRFDLVQKFVSTHFAQRQSWTKGGWLELGKINGLMVTIEREIVGGGAFNEGFGLNRVDK